MPIEKGQSYRANSFDLGFINMTPVDLMLQIMKIDTSTNELELTFVSADGHRSTDTGAAIEGWFQRIYPSRSKENCLLKNAAAFERLVDLKFVSPVPLFFLT